MQVEPALRSPRRSDTEAPDYGSRLAARLASADLAVPELPPPPLPLASDRTEYILHANRDDEHVYGYGDHYEESDAGHTTDRAPSMSDWTPPECGGDLCAEADLLSVYDDASSCKVDDSKAAWPDTYGTAPINSIHQMSAPAPLQSPSSPPYERDSLEETLDKLAASHTRMDSQSVPPPAFQEPSNSPATRKRFECRLSAPDSVVVSRQIDGFVSRWRRRSCKSSEGQRIEDASGVDHLNDLLDQLQASPTNRLEDQRARPPALVLRFPRHNFCKDERSHSAPADSPSTSFAVQQGTRYPLNDDTDRLFDCLERTSRGFEGQRAVPPATVVPASEEEVASEMVNAPRTAPASLPTPHAWLDKLRGKRDDSLRSRSRLADALSHPRPSVKWDRPSTAIPDQLGTGKNKLALSKMASRLQPCSPTTELTPELSQLSTSAPCDLRSPTMTAASGFTHGTNTSFPLESSGLTTQEQHSPNTSDAEDAPLACTEASVDPELHPKFPIRM